jgi:MFS family permease
MPTTSTSATQSTYTPPVTGHRAAVIASFLGWTLDAFDFFLVTYALTAIAKEFGRPDKAIALSLTITLAFRPVGAFIFGLMADRYGRKIPLMIDLVFYSVVEVATAPTTYGVPGAARALRDRHGRRMGGRVAGGEGAASARRTGSCRRATRSAICSPPASSSCLA